MAKPHILFICADQHRYDCLGANGHPLVRTPHLDGLARDGANFSHAFTPAPVCVPARCSLLTGRWPTQHGVICNFDGEAFKPLDPALPTCAAVVRDAGYRTIHIGHWHVDPKRSPHDFGFQEFTPDWRYRKWRAARGRERCPSDKGWAGQVDPHITPDESAPAWSAAQVIRWLERANDDADPLFIHWHLLEPHLPCRPPEPFASMYNPKQIAPWPGFAETFAGKPYIQQQMLRTWGIEHFTWNDWAPVVAFYLGAVSLVDFAVGNVLAALDRLGLRDNTLVIYSADHGDMCGSHRMLDKHYVMYDDIVRVPLLLRWPGVIPPKTTPDAFVSNALDLAATFCDAAGAPAPPAFAGTSLLPIARGDSRGERQDIFASYHGNQFGSFSQRMLRDRRWKYVWNATAEDELYDLQSDPGELRNRACDPQCAAELTRLRQRLLHWMEATNDLLLNHWIRTQLSENRKR